MADPTSTDAGRELYSRLRESQSFGETIKAYEGFLRRGLGQLSIQRAPVTQTLVYLTIAVFTIQVWFYSRVSGASEGLNVWFFLNYPQIAWPLTEFIHRGLGHFIANVLFLIILGRIVEPEFRSRYFVLWFLGVGLIATPVHAIVQLSISPKPFVAVSGISEFISALGVFVLLSFFHLNQKTELWYLGFLIGASAAIDEAISLIWAFWTWSMGPLNIGHTVGAILGLVVFLTVRIRQSRFN